MWLECQQDLFSNVKIIALSMIDRERVLEGGLCKHLGAVGSLE
jgi:hypothetical protein